MNNQITRTVAVSDDEQRAFETLFSLYAKSHKARPEVDTLAKPGPAMILPLFARVECEFMVN